MSNRGQGGSQFVFVREIPVLLKNFVNKTYLLATQKIAPKQTKMAFAQYSYRLGGAAACGPFNKEDIRTLHRKKIILEDTLIYCPASEGWQPYSVFPEFPKPSLRSFLHYCNEPHFAPIMAISIELIDAIVAGQTYANRAINQIREAIIKNGYSHPDYDIGTLNDLHAPDRIALIVDHNVKLRQNAIQCGKREKRLIGF